MGKTNTLSKDLVQERCYPDLATGCWNWTGSLNTCGYGQVKAGGENWTSHRASWTVFRGAIPEGLNVLHHCDNPKCCNPEHLYLGTHTDNMRDMIRRGRRKKKTGPKFPIEKLTEDQIRQIQSSDEIGAHLAKKMGISKAVVYKYRKLVSGEITRNWSHIISYASGSCTTSEPQKPPKKSAA